MSYRTVAEWRIPPRDGRDRCGWVWISQDLDARPDNGVQIDTDGLSEDELALLGNSLEVWVDPDGWSGDTKLAGMVWGIDPNALESMHACDSGFAVRVIAFWRRLGSPILDRSVPGYEAPWLPFPMPPNE